MLKSFGKLLKKTQPPDLSRIKGRKSVGNCSNLFATSLFLSLGVVFSNLGRLVWYGEKTQPSKLCFFEMAIYRVAIDQACIESSRF